MQKRKRQKRETLAEAEGQHLDYLETTWLACLSRAEKLVAYRSNDDLDDNIRRVAVFELAGGLFEKNALHFGEILRAQRLMK